MTIGNAKRFFGQVAADSAWREALTAARNAEERRDKIAAAGLSFTEAEFDEAYRSLLVGCQSEAAARTVQDVYQWWVLLDRV